MTVWQRTTGAFATLLEPQPEDPWDRGVSAYLHGKIPPADPDEAEGWYWAENALCQGKRLAGCVSRTASLVAFVGGAALFLSIAGQLA